MDYRQIKQIKAQNTDALLFVRIGDFYEAFEDDAITLSKELDLVLTGRNFQGASERIPMTGVPYHTLDQYIAKLVEKGYKVAIAESPQQQRETVTQPTITQNQTDIKENQKMENNNVTPYSEEERTEIVGQSKAYLTELLSNGNLKRLLELIGNNGKYTLNNTLFMLANAPNISVVKNMGDWNDLGRSIIPNSKSIEIMSPIKEERTVEPKDGAEPELDENGQPKVKKYTATTGFKPTYVFDISQTTGKEYKPFKITEKISDEEKRIVLKGVRNELGKKGYKIDFVDADKLGENESGRVDRKAKKVEIKKGMDNYATTLTLLHQSANALAGAYRYRDFEGLKGAEAYALEGSCMDCILAAHFGMDTSKFDFSYTKAWDDKEKTAFYNNANLICTTSTKLMEGVDHAFEYNATQSKENNAVADKTPPANRPSLFRGISQQSEAEAS